MGGPAKILYGLAAIGLVYTVGFLQGHDSSPEPVTHTVTKEVPVPGPTETKIEYRDKIIPLPEPCYTAVEQLPRITEGDAVQTAAVGEILLSLQDMGTAAAFNDIHKINALVDVVREEGSKINASVGDRNRAVITFNSYLAQCEKEIDSLSNP